MVLAPPPKSNLIGRIQAVNGHDLDSPVRAVHRTLVGAGTARVS